MLFRGLQGLKLSMLAHFLRKLLCSLLENFVRSIYSLAIVAPLNYHIREGVLFRHWTV